MLHLATTNEAVEHAVEPIAAELVGDDLEGTPIRGVPEGQRKAVVGGAWINTGTIPSKTLREAVLYLSGYRLRDLYGVSYSVKQDISMSDLLVRTDHVVR